jgi:hypothetical protein
VSGPHEALLELSERLPLTVVGEVGGAALSVRIAEFDVSVALSELRRAHAALERLFP